MARENLMRMHLENEAVYYLHTEYNESGEDAIILILSDSVDAWEGKVTKTELRKACTKVSMEYKEYMEQTMLALGSDGSKHEFQYDIEKLASSVKFSWKKYLSEDSVKIQLGSALLKRQDNPSAAIGRILDAALTRRNRDQGTITHLGIENERLAQERHKAIKLLEKYTAEKEEFEKDLFRKFVLLLNEKKAKIRKLEAHTLSSSSMSADKTVSSAASTEITASSSKAESRPGPIGSDSESDVDTDEESFGKRRLITKRAEFSPEVDTGDGGTDSRPTVRRRGKATPVKTKPPLVIHKSKTRTPSSKSSSRSSAVDADDLMDMM